eukprot:25249-Rhodomonas_salina.1
MPVLSYVAALSLSCVCLLCLCLVYGYGKSPIYLRLSTHRSPISHVPKLWIPVLTFGPPVLTLRIPVQTFCTGVGYTSTDVVSILVPGHRQHRRPDRLSIKFRPRDPRALRTAQVRPQP